MISGGQILWNAVAIFEMTKTSWQTRNLKMNEDLGDLSQFRKNVFPGIFVGYALIAWKNLERDILIAEIAKLEKLDASEQYPRRLNAKEILISTQKDRAFESPVADGSAKFSGRGYEFQEPTLRRESTVRKENLSGESHGDREEFRKTFGLLMDTSYIGIIMNREFQLYVPREESFFISKIYKEKSLIREEDWRSQNI